MMMASLGGTADDVSGTDHHIRWFDFRGNVVSEKWVRNGANLNMTFPPAANHYPLVVMGWTHAPSQLANIQHDYDIIALYGDNSDMSGLTSRLYMKIEAKAGQKLSFVISDCYIYNTTKILNWGDGTETEINKMQDVDLVVEHTYESDFDGWFEVRSGIGVQFNISNCDDIIREIHGIRGYGTNANYAISGQGSRYIKYVSYGKNIYRIRGQAGFVTDSPIISYSYSNIKGSSFPAIYFEQESQSEVCENVSKVTKIICSDDNGKQIYWNVRNCPDVEYVYISRNMVTAQTFSVLDNLPKLERIDIDEGWAPGYNYNIDLSSSVNLQLVSVTKFLQRLGTAEKSVLTLPTVIYNQLTEEQIAEVVAKNYTLQHK